MRMNILNGKKTKKLIAGVLFLFLFTMIAAPDQLYAGRCGKALMNCMVDAGIAAVLGAIAGFFSGNIIGSILGAATVGGSYSTMCLSGYDFCKRYYI
jgi:TM2 domain-containing membrane protein YozV